MMKVPSDLDYLIVLGAHVDGTRLTLALLERTRRALQYLKDNPRTKGTGEQISEAEAMYRYLTSRGIAGERLLLEDQSVNTAENIRFSLEKIGSKDVSIGVVTNNFHVFRGVAIGKKCGCVRIYPVPSRYRSWRLLIYVPREILAILKDRIAGNL